MDEWIDGLPTEPGRYYYALKFRAEDDWRINEGSARRTGNDSLVYVAAGDFVYTGDYAAIKHRAALPLPEAPDATA
jgi:hypothetical protein